MTMPVLPEVFADMMTRFTVSKDGSVAKVVFASTRPKSGGSMEAVPILVLTMPVPALQAMSIDVLKALGLSTSAAPTTKN